MIASSDLETIKSTSKHEGFVLDIVDTKVSFPF